MRRLLRGVIVAGLSVVIVLGVILLMTPVDRELCRRQMGPVCDGAAGVVIYEGISGFSSCEVRCGTDEGDIRLVDRSWPFGPDRDKPRETSSRAAR